MNYFEIFNPNQQYAPAQIMKVGQSTYIRQDLVDKQIAELENKYERLNQERYEEGLNLQQFYSHLCVEAYGEDIQEQAIKELERLKAKETKRVKKLEQQLAEKNEELEMANEDRAFRGEMWSGFADKCKALTNKLHTQPREIAQKIKKNLHNYILSNDNDFAFGSYVKVVDIDKVLQQILKEYEEKGNERDN